MTRVFCDRCNALVMEDGSVKKGFAEFHIPTLFAGEVSEAQEPKILCKDCAREYRKLIRDFYGYEED